MDKKKYTGETPPDDPGVIPGGIPRGLEVLIKKAVVDPAFKDILFEKRAAAAEAIGLKLTAAEEAMLAAVPLPHLEGIIAHTHLSPKLKPVFLGYAAGTMLAALAAATTACDGGPTAPPVEGIRPDPPTGVIDRAQNEVKQPEKEDEPVTRGIRPHRP